MTAGLLAAFCWTGMAAALDQIRTHSKDVLRGRITEISPQAVKIDKSPIEETVPVNEIISIAFDREPDELSKGRNLTHVGDFQGALEALKKVNREDVAGRAEMRQDLDYYTAYCTAKVALAGGGNLNAALSAMRKFVTDNKTSFHYYPAAELTGDVSVAIGTEALRGGKQDLADKAFPFAMQWYDEAGKGNWPGAAAGPQLKRGRAYLAQKKPADAVKEFESVLSDAAGPNAESLKLAATLGKANALAMGGKAEEGIKIVEDVINKTPKSDVDLHAQAYLALGNCHKAANKPKEAIMDYLHVDLLYFQDPQIHAEALRQLAQLWQSLNRPDRAREANAKLPK
jgi:tetratricopeptide (TPR) repeat protein